VTPLNELADWARPDSTAARLFSGGVDQWLFGAGPLEASSAAPLIAQLTSWRDAGELAAQAPVAATRISQARVVVANSLTALGRTGLQLVAALVDGKTLPADRQSAARAVMDAAAQDTAAAGRVSLSSCSPDARSGSGGTGWARPDDA